MTKYPIKNPDHKAILDKIREIAISLHSDPLHEPEDWGLNEYHKNDKPFIEVSFDYGVPHDLWTPEGMYTIACGIPRDTKKFWELFTAEFNTEIVKPQRDESKTSYLDFQLLPSGPYVKLNPFPNGKYIRERTCQ